MIHIIRFISSSEDWVKAKVRFIIVNDDSDYISSSLSNNLTSVLTEYRISGEVKVVNNHVDKKPFKEILNRESIDSDLIITGLPEFKGSEPVSEMNKIHDLVEGLPTTIFVKASSLFEDIYIGIDRRKGVNQSMDESDDLSELKFNHADLPQNNTLNLFYKSFADSIEKLTEYVSENVLQRYYQSIIQPLNEIKQLSEKSTGVLYNKGKTNSSPRFQKVIEKVHSEFLFNVHKYISEFRSNQLPVIHDELESGLLQYSSRLTQLIENLPNKLIIHREEKELITIDSDSMFTRLIKFFWRIRVKLTGNLPSKEISIKTLLKYYLIVNYHKRIKFSLQRACQTSYSIMRNVVKYSSQVEEVFRMLESDVNKELKTDRKNLERYFTELDSNLNKSLSFYISELTSSKKELALTANDLLHSSIHDCERHDPNTFIRNERRVLKKEEKEILRIQNDLENWRNNLMLIQNSVELDLSLLKLKHRIDTNIDWFGYTIRLEFENNCLNKISDQINHFKNLMEELKSADSVQVQNRYDFSFSINSQAKIEQLISESLQGIKELPKTLKLMDQESYNLIQEDVFASSESHEFLNESAYVTLVMKNLIEPLQTELISFSELVEVNLKQIKNNFRLTALNIGSSSAESDLWLANEEKGNDRLLIDSIDNLKKSVKKLRPNWKI